MSLWQAEALSTEPYVVTGFIDSAYADFYLIKMKMPCKGCVWMQGNAPSTSIGHAHVHVTHTTIKLPVCTSSLTTDNFGHRRILAA